MTKPQIGSKYTGKHEVFKDTRSGVYSESCPPLVKQESNLQAVLLEHAERMARKRPRPIRQVDLPDPSVRAAIDTAHNALKASAHYHALSDNHALEAQNHRDKYA